jgi:hypothetical protein
VITGKPNFPYISPNKLCVHFMANRSLLITQRPGDSCFSLTPANRTRLIGFGATLDVSGAGIGFVPSGCPGVPAAASPAAGEGAHCSQSLRYCRTKRDTALCPCSCSRTSKAKGIPLLHTGAPGALGCSLIRAEARHPHRGSARMRRVRYRAAATAARTSGQYSNNVPQRDSRDSVRPQRHQNCGKEAKAHHSHESMPAVILVASCCFDLGANEVATSGRIAGDGSQSCFESVKVPVAAMRITSGYLIGIHKESSTKTPRCTYP